MKKSSSQNTGFKNKFVITTSNKKIKRLNTDLKKNTLNKSHKHADLKNKDNKFKVQENVNTSPTIESMNECNLKNYKKRRYMYERIKTPKCTLDQEPVTSHKDININIAYSKKGITSDRKSTKNKKKMFDSLGEEYKPGMLSDSIQKKKYGCVIIPWDPSFGLDKTYKIPEIKNKDLPKLKINPLFDLSKRQDISSKLLVDKKQCSIFVGNLPSNIRINEIKKLFKKCGLIHNVKLKVRNRNVKSSNKIANEDQRHKNAIITFKQAESCNKALKLNGHIYKDCHLQVNKASDSTKHEESGKTVFVGNLAFMAEDEDLWKAFGSCGEIQGVRIVRERNGKGKGYGYVNFKAEEAVDKALELDGLSILNRDIRVRRNKIGTSTYPKTFDERRKKKDNPEFCDKKDDEQKKIKEFLPNKSIYQGEHKRKKGQKNIEKQIKLEPNESIQIKEEKINKKVNDDFKIKAEETVEKALELEILNRDIRIRRNETGTSSYTKTFDERRKKKDNSEFCDEKDEEQKKIKEDLPNKSTVEGESKRKKRHKDKEKKIKLEPSESIQMQTKEEKINKTVNDFKIKLKKIPKALRCEDYINR